MTNLVIERKETKKKALTPEESKKVVDFVKIWRKKAFCICRHIRGELKLKVSLSTIARCLSKHGYYWRAVPKKSLVTDDQIKWSAFRQHP